MVNYHTLLLQGREPVRTALIDLWADDGLTGAERIRLLSHLLTDLRERDVHLVMALRCAMMPIWAFAGNLFLPTPYANSCYNEPNASIANADKRDCATGHHNADGTVSSCGIIKSLGKCKNVCSKINGAGQYYPSCVDKPGFPKSTTEYVITTALP